MARVNQDRTILGPLTTFFTPPEFCMVHATGTVGLPIFLGQTCGPTGVQDEARCWPTAKPNVAKLPPFNGWGFYSPGLRCPAGYTTACRASANVAATITQAPRQFAMEAGETAIGCCPT